MAEIQKFQFNNMYDAGYELPTFLIDNYLSHNQLIRLFSLKDYSSITHDLYYHIGKFFKKRYLAEKSELRKLAGKLWPLEIGDVETDPFWKESNKETRTALRTQYQKMRDIKKEWQNVFRLIRGDSKEATMFRQGVSSFVRTMIRGDYIYSGLERSPTPNVEDQFKEYMKSRNATS